jgi:uncharacterized protein (DUF433 family)
MDEDGVFRVGRTRVRLDSVLGAFKNGCVAEEILFKYPSLNLTDIYAVITYYLWHRKEVDAYLDERQRRAEEVCEENEKRFPAAGVRERLLSRREHKS